MATAILNAPQSAQDHAAGYSDKRRKLALLVIATAFVLDLMDSTIMNIASLPFNIPCTPATRRCCGWPRVIR